MPSDPSFSEFLPSQPRPGRWILPWAACFLLAFLFSLKQTGSYDLGLHLAGGRWIVQNHRVPSKDSFTYTQNDQDYLDPHWLYQAALYLCQNAFGYNALTLVHSLAVLAVLLLLFLRLRALGAGPGLSLLFLFTAVLMTERRFMVRPEVFSWLFLSLTLWVLEGRDQGRDRLALLPWIQLLWVNIEGLFMLGWAAMGAHALGGRLRNGRWDPKVVRFSLLALAADLVNPYFLKALSYPLVLLTRFQSSGPYKQTISEFSGPWHYFQSQRSHHDLNLQILLFFLVLALTALSLAASIRFRPIKDLLLFLAFGILGLSMVRNLPLFTLVALPILASCWTRWSLPGWVPKVPERPLILGSTLFLLAFCGRVATNAYYVDDRRLDRFGTGLDQDRLPVRAVEFLKDHKLEGRILNNMPMGGWLEWAGPQRTFVDGRLEVMSQGFFTEYLRSFRNGELGMLLIRYQPQLLLFEYNSATSWTDQLRRLPEWRLIYLDECAAIYAREDYAPGLKALSFPSLAADRDIPAMDGQRAAQELAEFQPSDIGQWMTGFYKRQTYPMGLSAMGYFCLRAGEYGAARDLFMACLRRTGGGYSEIYFNLGITYLYLHDIGVGKAFLGVVQRMDPHNQAANEMMGQLKSL